ncbi:helix-turn-helix domain-containing protein [Ulvibacterium sp.]|uniref:AlbA family DNA-binding domain-containing protein n=1 Tax=Ulvibacterium sp. TaxID=2665914 RepID=UPI0026393AC9|nr:ATP-binding protein [Ulvibacterium sp.]
MKELHKYDSYDFEFLQSLIDNKIEEGLNLEFKSGEALQKTPRNKKEISKDIAAMANSNGGLIIYGLLEKDNVADSFVYVDGNSFTKESLEQIISSTIKRLIPNLKIFPIRKDDDISKSIYIVQIPESSESPHMSVDKRFYLRNNFGVAPMEEYQVRNLYEKKSSAKVILSALGLYIHPEEGDVDETRLQVVVSIKNVGETMTKEYRANIIFNGLFEFVNITWEAIGQGKNYSSTTTPGIGIKITNELPTTIYPSEELDVIGINLDVKTKHLEAFIEKMELSALLYFNNESSIREYTGTGRDRLLKDLKNKEGVFSFLRHDI